MFGYKFIKEKDLAKMLAISKNVGAQEERQRQHGSRNAYLSVEIEGLRGLPVIYVDGNGKLGIGFVVDVQYLTMAKIATPVVHNYITNRREIIMFKVYAFTDERFQALARLTPVERVSLFMASSYSLTRCNVTIEPDVEDIEKIGYGNISEVINALVKNGFFTKLVEFETAKTEQAVKVEDLSAPSSVEEKSTENQGRRHDD